MRKIVKPCGLHCIRINHLGVTIGEQQILSDVNLHIHCGKRVIILRSKVTENIFSTGEFDHLGYIIS